MKRYRVINGAAQVGQADILGLSKAQFAARKHRVEADTTSPLALEQIQKNGEIIICRPLEVLEFKAGEEIMLAVAPSKVQALHLEPVGHDDGLKRPVPESSLPSAGPLRRARRAA